MSFESFSKKPMINEIFKYCLEFHNSEKII